MKNKIKKFLGGVLYLVKSKNEKLDTNIINNKSINTVVGTITKKKDKDTDWYNNLAKNSNNIYEIGCNIGQTLVYALTNDNIKKVALVDANPQALFIANKNLIFNNWIHKTTSFLGFVSDKSNHQIDFYTIGHGAAGSMYKSHAETAASINSFYSVNTITLDELSTLINWIPDFIKIDVEGAERFVLSGGKELLKNNEIKLLVEMHSNDELSMLQNGNYIIELCDEIHYSVWYLDTKEIITSGDAIAHRGRCHLLLQPKNNNFPKYL